MRVTCCKMLCCIPTFCVVHTVNRFDLWISKQYRRLAFKTMYVQFSNEAKSCAYWFVNKTLWYKIETFDFQSETRSRTSHVSTRPRRLETTSRDRLETETTSLASTTAPSYIQVCAVVWAYGWGETHRQPDTQTQVTTIHFASSTTHAKCNNDCQNFLNVRQ